HDTPRQPAASRFAANNQPKSQPQHREQYRVERKTGPADAVSDGLSIIESRIIFRSAWSKPQTESQPNRARVRADRRVGPTEFSLKRPAFLGRIHRQCKISGMVISNVQGLVADAETAHPHNSPELR